MGEGISRSGVDPAQVWVTTKVWIDDFAPERLRRSAEGSLERLGLDSTISRRSHADNGATSTAALLPASVRDNSSSTASIGSGVSKVRGKQGSVRFFPSPLVGEGGFAKRRRVRGSHHTARLKRRIETPHPALRATFSHKGRREEGA